jgi:hypothetical protein
MTTLEQRGLERRRYRQGQLLLGADLRREAHDETELEWWHNRALHDAYGVVVGLEVELRVAGDESWAVVNVGMAYDGYGRPLLVDRPLAVGVPPDSAGAVLVLRSRAEDDGLADPSRPAACAAGQPSTELCWARTGRVGPREGVALACLTATALASLPADVVGLPARVKHDGSTGQLQAIGRLGQSDLEAGLKASGDASYTAALKNLYQSSQSCPWPHRARPLARRPMASGTTQAGNTQWQAWTIPIPRLRGADLQLPIGFEVRVDTTSAGFTAVPQYFAWLQGPLFDDVGSAMSGGVHWDHIEDRAPDGFTFRSSVIARSILPGARERQRSGRDPWVAGWSEMLGILRDDGFYVSWLGIEPSGAELTAVRRRDEVRDGQRV